MITTAIQAGKVIWMMTLERSVNPDFHSSTQPQFSDFRLEPHQRRAGQQTAGEESVPAYLIIAQGQDLQVLLSAWTDLATDNVPESLAEVEEPQVNQAPEGAAQHPQAGKLRGRAGTARSTCRGGAASFPGGSHSGPPPSSARARPRCAGGCGGGCKRGPALIAWHRPSDSGEQLGCCRPRELLQLRQVPDLFRDDRELVLIQVDDSRL